MLCIKFQSPYYPVNMQMVIQPLVRRWANVLMSACPNIGPTLANSKNSISVIIQLPKIWLAWQPLTNIGPMLEWCWHYVPNIGPMLGQVDIGTLAQRRTNGWQMVGPTLAHRRPNIGMFMGYGHGLWLSMRVIILHRNQLAGQDVIWQKKRWNRNSNNSRKSPTAGVAFNCLTIAAHSSIIGMNGSIFMASF